MIGLAMMRAMKMALSVDAGYSSLMLSHYLNGPQIETGFDFFPFIKTCVAQHQQNGMMNRQLRTFSLFCLKCCVFESQLYLAAAYSIQYFSPYTSIWYECYLLRHLKKLIRHYRMIWDYNSPWKIAQNSPIRTKPTTKGIIFIALSLLYFEISFYIPSLVFTKTCPLP